MELRETPQVELLTSIRIPACHEGVVRMKCDEMLLMEALEDDANPQIKEMTEPALVKTDERGEFIMVLTNHSWEAYQAGSRPRSGPGQHGGRADHARNKPGEYVAC